MKYFILSSIVFLALIFIWRYIPLTSAERVQFCIDTHITDTNYESADKAQIQASIVKILNNECTDQFEDYKNKFLEKTPKEKQEIARDAISDFTPEQAATFLIDRYYQDQK